MDCVIHDVNLASVKTSNVRDFLYNNIQKILSGYKCVYLWVSHKQYNINFATNILKPKREFSDENFIYDMSFANNYMQVINEISDVYIEFQFWELCFTNDEIKEFSQYHYPFPPGKKHKDGFTFYKGVENDVVWIEKNEVEAAIVDFI